MRKFYALAIGSLAVAGTVAGLEARAAEQLGTSTNSPACCSLTTSLAQDLLDGPDLPGDERFFMSAGAPPNIHFLLDTSGSMVEIPQVKDSDYASFYAQGDTNAADPLQLGCSNSLLRAFETANGWNGDGTGSTSATTYPPTDPGTGYGSDGVGNWNNMFTPAAVYAFNEWGAKAYKTNPPTFASSVSNACGSGGLGLTGTPLNNCKACLNTYGFYKIPGAVYDDSTSAKATASEKKFLFTGNFLRFDPPKYITAVTVLKRVLVNLNRIRAGFTTFSSSSSGWGGHLLQQQNPPCDKALAGQQNADRASYVNTLDNTNSVVFDHWTPLAQTLLNIGQYFSSDDTVFQTTYGMGSTAIKPSSESFSNGSLNGQNRSVCWGCQVSSVAIITDGQPTLDYFDDAYNSAYGWPKTNVINKIIAANGGEVKCPSTDPCAIETTDHKGSYLDDVAQFLYTHDLQIHTPVVVGQLNTAGQQSVITYGVGLGVNNPLLRNAANVGGGFYTEANSVATLQAALASIISNVQSRATSFSAASVSSLQVNKTGGSLLPRFKPSKAGENANWNGFLYRFDLGSEAFLDGGCDPRVAATLLDGGAGDPNDLNQDGLCDEVLLDKNGDAVLEDDNGNFVKYRDTTLRACPYWEAGLKLTSNQAPPCGSDVDAGTVDAGTGTPAAVWTTRKIFTMVDRNGDGKIDASDAPAVAFDDTTADVALLMPYLGIGNNPTDCDDVASQMGLSSGGLTPTQCAKTVIDWYRGADAISSDPSRRTKDRSWLLSDIFHSAPIEVEPATSSFFCLFSSQCLPTLFTKTLTPLNPSTAYDSYVGNPGAPVSTDVNAGVRDKIVLVGSNDGLLHAFWDGAAQRNGAGYRVDATTLQPDYTAGDGRELWAFIPPDLLPKMRRHIGKHGYFLDDSAMVREVWIDGRGNSKDGQKEKEEFRTVAVVGEGRGGVHHFALDLTDLIPNGNVDSTYDASAVFLGTAGKPSPFLWMWPQPCSPESLWVGESFSNYAPRPPPIGPVAIADSNAGYFSPGPFKVNGVAADEDWVVMFNGGYDPYLSRGRGFAMVELGTGNTLWEKFFGDGSALADKMRYPFAAGVSMLDVGRGGSVTQLSGAASDYIFDTATVPDFGGDVWTLRFWLPGVLDPATKRVTNWTAARSFQVQTDDTHPAVVEPFTEMTANTIDTNTGLVHTYLGSGDRNHLTDTSGPHCRFDNPYGCSEIGCYAGTTDWPISVTIQRGATTSQTSTAEYRQTTYRTSTSVTGTTGNSCAADDMKVAWNYDGGSFVCNLGPTTGYNEWKCADGQANDAGSWACSQVHGDWTTVDPVDFSVPDGGVLGQYYGFVSFGSGQLLGSDPVDAGTGGFDGARLHPSGLINMTNATILADGGTSVVGPSKFQSGWYISYTQDERTATGTAIVDGCVVWNSFMPESSGNGAICSTAGANIASLYQADSVSGQPNCATAFQVDGVWNRKLSRSVVAVPGEPAVQRTVANGQSGSSVIILEAGRTQGNTVSQNKDILQSIYTVEVDRPEHQCRHEGALPDGGPACE